MLCASNVGASEIFGRISTDPNAQPGNTNNPPASAEQPSPVPQTETKEQVGGAVILPLQNVQKSQTITQEVKVLGASYYPDGSLLRDSSNKIYLIQGQVKKYIPNLHELAKYRGQAILEVTDQDLSQYQTREHLTGELIRQRGEVKVYEIVAGGKHHILNLEELRAHYFGKEIFNISGEEMTLYI